MQVEILTEHHRGLEIRAVAGKTLVWATPGNSYQGFRLHASPSWVSWHSGSEVTGSLWSRPSREALLKAIDADPDPLAHRSIIPWFDSFD